jgi:hypothetical protein
MFAANDPHVVYPLHPLYGSPLHVAPLNGGCHYAPSFPMVPVADSSRLGGAKKKKAAAPKKASSQTAAPPALSLKRTSLAKLMASAIAMMSPPNNYPLAIVLQWMVNHHAPMKHLDVIAQRLGKPASRSRSRSKSKSKSKSKSTKPKAKPKSAKKKQKK